MTDNSNNSNSNPTGTTADTILNDLYTPAPVSNGHLIGIQVEDHPQGVVTDKDYDRIVAERAAAARAPSPTPSAPSVAPNATVLDLSSARTSTGQRVSDPAEATAETIVTYMGMETTLGALMAAGEVTRDANGQYLAAAPEAGGQEQTQTDAPSQTPLLDERSEAIMADALAKAPGQVIGAAISFIEGDGMISDEAVAQLAANAGLEPEAARERLAHVVTAYSREATQMTAKAIGASEGIVAEALEWARTAKASDLKQMAQRHFNEGSSKADYTNFAIDYLASMDQRDPNRILQGGGIPGRGVHWDRSAGRVIVTMGDGTQMSWEEAVRARLVSM